MEKGGLLGRFRGGIPIIRWKLLDSRAILGGTEEFMKK